MLRGLLVQPGLIPGGRQPPTSSMSDRAENHNLRALSKIIDEGIDLRRDFFFSQLTFDGVARFGKRRDDMTRIFLPAVKLVVISSDVLVADQDECAKSKVDIVIDHNAFAQDLV